MVWYNLPLLLWVFFLMTGVHTGEFMGIPPTGKHVVCRFASFDKVVDGKIVSSEIFPDMLGLFVQLGVMEPPKGF
jgi:predicted ester cyclase